MADYYDRLEAQLGELTARGAHRRRLVVAPPRLGIGVEFIAVAASVLVVVAVAAVLLSAGAGRHAARHGSPARHGVSRMAVLRNIYPAPLPAPSGQLVCDSSITGPSGRGSARGTVRFYTAPPTRTQMFVTAGGLRQISAGKVYAVWLLPAVGTTSGGYQLQSSQPPQLLGMIEPSVGSTGRVTIATLLSAQFNGAYKFLITVQPRSSTRAPGATMLEGFVSF